MMPSLWMIFNIVRLVLIGMNLVRSLETVPFVSSNKRRVACDLSRMEFLQYTKQKQGLYNII